MADALALQRELETYNDLLPSLHGSEGKFALIVGDKLLGVFDTYSDALNEGYKERGLEPFMVKKISAVEAVAYFTRDLNAACRTTPTQ